MLGWSGKFPDDPKCPKFGTSIVSTAYGAYLDHADAQNLAKPPFMRICREFENWRDLRALSGKFLRQKSCYPESFRFLWLWEGASLTFINFFLTINLWCNRHSDFKTLHVPPSNSALVDKRGLAGVWDKEEDAESLPEKDPCCQTNICTNIACGVQNGFSAFLVLFLSVQKKN